MFYTQITTRCNMTCAHCGFNCTAKGQDMSLPTFYKAMMLHANYGEDYITLGGGEPTLHPQFWDILKHCISDFEYTWFATNGSQTEIMQRLANILWDEDRPKCTCDPDDLESYGECVCHERLDYDVIWAEGKLGVDLSQDPWHDAIDPWVVDTWNRWADFQESGFMIRDTSHDIIKAGRAETNDLWVSDECVCSSKIIQPDGKIRLCGCTDAPIIGDVYSGISLEWEDRINDDESYRFSKCYRDLEQLEEAI